MKNFFKKNWFKILVLILLLLLVVSACTKNNVSNISYRTAVAKRGDLSVSVSGTGTISASESRQEISKVSSTVENVYYVEGDNVEKGTPIVKLDSSDYEVNIKSQVNAIRQAEVAKENLERQINNLKIVSTSSGYVSNLNLVEGTYVMTNMDVCTITNSQKDEVTLQFVSSFANQIQVGNHARVLLTGSLNYVDGVVSFVGNRVYTLSSGATVVDVTIQVTDSRFALTGVNASAEIMTEMNTVKSVNEAAFSATQSGNVKAETSGSVKKVYVKNGQYVAKGELIAELENNDLVTNMQTTQLSIQNLYTQLNYSNDKLKDYTITAPIDGTITFETIKEGDIVSPGTLIATISNKNEFEFKIPVDELDISKINYDKKVKVTIDALPYTSDEPIIGKISKMPLEGTSTGGVTDYYVTITFPGKDDVRISMNADAEIVIDEKEDVLYIPIESIDKEDGQEYVYIVNDGKAIKRQVTTGLKGLAYVEIISGIDEGEEVVVPEQGTGFGFMLNMM